MTGRGQATAGKNDLELKKINDVIKNRPSWRFAKKAYSLQYRVLITYLVNTIR